MYDINKLTTEELLAMALRERPNSNVVKDLAEKFSSSQSFYHASVHELQEIKGLGPSKAALLKAILELGYRLLTMSLDHAPVINNTIDAAKILYPKLCLLDREHFMTVYLNTKHRVLGVETVFIGTLDKAIVHPREVYKGALRYSASKIIVAHNHPSGDPQPSTEDVEVTEQLVVAGKIMGIELWDHIIFGGNSFFSLKSSGLM